MQETIGILGGTGWLGLALGLRSLTQGVVTAGQLVVANRRGPTSDYDAWPGVTWARNLGELAERSDIVVLSVRPEDYAAQKAPAFAGIVVSFMAGVPLAHLERNWPDARIVRAMPGGGAREGNAHVPICAADGIADADLDLVERLLSVIGTVDRVANEHELAFLTALSGSGAAYPALMAKAMYDRGVAEGITPEVVWRAVTSVVCDAPSLLRGSPAEASHMLETLEGYRGPTAAGIEAARLAGLGKAIGSALDAATKRAETMRPGEK
ncbi:putative pyrroline-5-carboxylate reductase protein [Fulvimarina pelagi HTCC2506]|uniref:Pyrroline-5-carboxylate reductase n=1 Tax=Fulvimarina pelagi HTCC2506 TaxID=314231 RepID=Q0G398_9HYPH|nr:pyrroline-5-carboxylate reductase dimerization domain-containing protein [Fulvimarina pelagi]EAU41933.1 putative pyrroline-5-carboxylate reductase protein [Fulvimarina pelagi HTCC2506]